MTARWAMEAYERLQDAQREVMPQEIVERKREMNRNAVNARIKRRLARVV